MWLEESWSSCVPRRGQRDGLGQAEGERDALHVRPGAGEGLGIKRGAVGTAQLEVEMAERWPLARVAADGAEDVAGGDSGAAVDVEVGEVLVEGRPTVGVQEPHGVAARAGLGEHDQTGAGGERRDDER